MLLVINVLQQLNDALKWKDFNTVKQCITNPVLKLEEYPIKAKDMQYAYELLLVQINILICNTTHI